MKLTENTKVRIKVPKHMYEAIQAELHKKPEMEEAESQTASLEEVAAAMDKALAFAKKLGQQIADKKGGSITQKDQSRLVDNFRSKVREFSPLKPEMPAFEDEMKEGYEEKMEETEVNEYVGMSPDQAQIVDILGQLIAGGGLALGIKTALQVALDKIKSKKSGDAEDKEPVVAEEEVEEALELETLMEAVKDIAKKKAEAKKKKEAEEKKKKEAEAKKKAEAAKKK
jgi:hypothetical protein